MSWQFYLKILKIDVMLIKLEDLDAFAWLVWSQTKSNFVRGA